MDQKMMIDDLVKMLDAGMTDGVGHINVECTDDAEKSKEVQTLGCTDCSRTPLACSTSSSCNSQGANTPRPSSPTISPGGL